MIFLHVKLPLMSNSRRIPLLKLHLNGAPALPTRILNSLAVRTRKTKEIVAANFWDRPVRNEAIVTPSTIDIPRLYVFAICCSGHCGLPLAVGRAWHASCNTDMQVTGSRIEVRSSRSTEQTGFRRSSQTEFRGQLGSSGSATRGSKGNMLCVITSNETRSEDSA